MTKTTEVLEYTESRAMGRSVSAYIAFFNACKDGKNVIFGTQQGEIWSPEYAKKMIEAAKEEGFKKGEVLLKKTLIDCKEKIEKGDDPIFVLSVAIVEAMGLDPKNIFL